MRRSKSGALLAILARFLSLHCYCHIDHVGALAVVTPPVIPDPLMQPKAASTFLVTGGSGYVGREVAHALLKKKETRGKSIICLVRAVRLNAEKAYWEHESCVTVQPYDMLDGGKSLREALDQVVPTSGSANDDTSDDVCVYHVASWFSPSEDHEQMARNNVQGTEDLVRVLGSVPLKCKLVVTSSMAAVRATSQEPSNGKFYTRDDWNNASELGTNWGSSYQWSKAESERRAWTLAKELNVPMVSLCPSFVFGPPTSSGELSSSFSVELVSKWLTGESEVQSRLFVDIRDVALAHVTAGLLPHAVGQRYILSTERRLASKDVAEVLREMIREAKFGDPDSIKYDADFSGGAIPIGEKEVDCECLLREELLVTLQPPEKTIADMGEFLIKMGQK